MLLAAWAAGSTQKECKGGAGHAGLGLPGACGHRGLCGEWLEEEPNGVFRLGDSETLGVVKEGSNEPGMWDGGHSARSDPSATGSVLDCSWHRFRDSKSSHGNAQAAENHSSQRDGCAENYSRHHLGLCPTSVPQHGDLWQNVF